MNEFRIASLTMLGGFIYFERPQLTRLRFHVLQTAQPFIKKIVQEYTRTVFSFLYVKLVYIRSCGAQSVSSDQIYPFVKL
jgi:hypothetical protein